MEIKPFFYLYHGHRIVKGCGAYGWMPSSYHTTGHGLLWYLKYCIMHVCKKQLKSYSIKTLHLSPFFPSPPPPDAADETSSWGHSILSPSLSHLLMNSLTNLYLAHPTVLFSYFIFPFTLYLYRSLSILCRKTAIYLWKHLIRCLGTSYNKIN